VLVLDQNNSLWLEHGPFGTNVPPPREQIDRSVQSFQGLDKDSVLVLDNHQALWLDLAPFGNVPLPPTQVKPVIPYLPEGGPAFLLGASNMISIRGNHVGNWLGPYCLNLGNPSINAIPGYVPAPGIGSGVYNCIVEEIQVSSRAYTQWPFLNVGSVYFQGGGGTNVRIRNNEILSLSGAGTTRMTIANSASSPHLDAGLRLKTYRFAASDLQPTIFRPGFPPPPPRQLAVYIPLDDGVALFPTIAMEEPGYVVLVVARLTYPINQGNWTVQVQIKDIHNNPISMNDDSGKPILSGIMEQWAEGRPTPLGLFDPENDFDNQFPAGAQLGVTVETSATFPVSISPARIDVVVDVTVGFGALGV
jgi:hypothetical protein